MVTKNPSLEGVDEGDGKCNDLVLSCPYFRNEIGGEEERVICLSRQTASSFNEDSMGQVNHAPVSRSRSQDSTSSSTVLLHRPNMAAGLSLLEDANERRWRLKSCPYQKLTNEKSFIIENFDIGATYYRERFYGTEHQNWFGVDDSLGPIAISIRKEKVAIVSSSVPSSTVTSPTSEVTTPVGTTSGPVSLQSSTEGNSTTYKYQYRLIIRTSELSVLRGCVFESCIPGLSSSSSRHNHHLNHHAKEVIEYLFPEISLPCLRLGVLNADEQLLKLDEQVLTTTYKVGVLFCKDNQSSEQEMYNNENSSAAFDEFLSILGEKVRLKGFSRYRGGLDNKTDTSGTHSIYKTFNDCEVMFHVSTLLPFTPNNKQQLLRKSRIGNDIVTIIFQEANAKPFTPKDNFKSHFQHVFIVVRQLPSSGQGQPVKYAVAVMRSKEVPVFGPPIPEGGIFTKSKKSQLFL
jgi:signal-induced proliferation-associated 1 like protein 1